MKQEIKVIILDFGGVYFVHSNIEAIRRIVSKTGMSKLQILYLLVNRRKIIQLIEKYNDFDLGKVNEHELWDYVRDITEIKTHDKELTRIYLSTHKPIKGMPELIQKLKEKYKLAMLTNNNIWLDKLNEKFDFYKNFDLIVNSYLVKIAKPDTKIYKLTLKQLKLKPEQCVFVDDKKENVNAARKLGMIGIQFKNTENLIKELKSNGVFI